MTQDNKMSVSIEQTIQNLIPNPDEYIIGFANLTGLCVSVCPIGKNKSRGLQ